MPTENLLRHFAKFGEVTDAVIMVDPITAKPRGFGFVTFKDPSLVESVCKEKHTLDNKAVRENNDILLWNKLCTD